MVRPAPHKSIGMREDCGPVWSPDGTQMAAIVDGLLTAWPVAGDGAPLGPPRPLSTDRAGSPTWSGDSRQILFQTDSGLRIVDVAARRVVRDIAPRLTWTQAPPKDIASDTGGAARSKTIYAGRFWDGKRDTLQRDVDILIEGNRIKSVEPHRAGRRRHGDRRVERDGHARPDRDAHASEPNFGEALGRAFLSWGITTVRNPAANTFEAIEFRESFESGARVGPRCSSTGEPFDGTRVYYPGGVSLGDTSSCRWSCEHASDFGSTSSRPTCGCPI